MGIERFALGKIEVQKLVAKIAGDAKPYAVTSNVSRHRDQAAVLRMLTGQCVLEIVNAGSKCQEKLLGLLLIYNRCTGLGVNQTVAKPQKHFKFLTNLIVLSADANLLKYAAQRSPLVDFEEARSLSQRILEGHGGDKHAGIVVPVLDCIVRLPEKVLAMKGIVADRPFSGD